MAKGGPAPLNRELASRQVSAALAHLVVMHLLASAAVGGGFVELVARG